MSDKEIHLLIALSILFLLYFLVTKLYKFWVKVGVHVFNGLVSVYRTKKEAETIFSIIKDWYNNKDIFCITCNASGVISECCNSQVNNIRVKEKKDGYDIIKRRTQCIECGALCNTIKCYCRK